MVFIDFFFIFFHLGYSLNFTVVCHCQVVGGIPLTSRVFFLIPLPSSGDCSPVSGPTTWLLFATPVRGLELSEIWGLFIQIGEILLQQWNCVFSPLDVTVFFIPILFQTSSIIFYVSKFFRFTL